MKDYKRLTSYMQVGNKVVAIQPQRKERIQAYIDRLFNLEDKIENGELCEREEVRKETVIEIIEILKSYDEENYLQELENIIAEKYGVELEDEQ